MNRYFIISCLCVAVLLTPLVEATTVKPINIETLTYLAQDIVKAKLISSQTTLDKEESGKMVQYHTWKVLDVIAGDSQVEEELVFKQLADGQYLSDQGVVINQRLYFPKYTVGQTYMLFLPNAHPDTGLLAPIGLFQGVYEVKVDVNGKEHLPQLNSRARYLRKDMPSQGRFLGLQKQKVEQSSDYNSFKSMVQEAMAL